MIFAEVAITAGGGDFPGVGGNFLLHQFLILGLAAFEAFPRNQHGTVLFGLFAANERLDGGMTFDEPREERTLVHVVEHRRQLQCAREVLDDFDVRGRGQFGQQFMVVQDKFAQTVRAFFIELIPLHCGEHGAKNFRTENVGKGVAAFASEPEQQFAVGRVLIDEARERVLEQIHLAFLDEQAGKLTAQLRGNGIQ